MYYSLGIVVFGFQLHVYCYENQKYIKSETNAAISITTIGRERVYPRIPTLGTTTTGDSKGELDATTLPLQTDDNTFTVRGANSTSSTTKEANATSDTPKKANTTSGPIKEANSTSFTTKESNATSVTTDEAGVVTTGDGHNHTEYEVGQEASKPVEEGLGSTGRIGSFSHPTFADSQTSTTPDVSPCSTSLIIVKQLQKSNNTESILYGMLPVFCTSLVINICTITWILRNNACKRRDVIQNDLKTDTKFIPTTGIYMYDTADDDTVYQELDQLSGPSHYIQL